MIAVVTENDFYFYKVVLKSVKESKNSWPILHDLELIYFLNRKGVMNALEE